MKHPLFVRAFVMREKHAKQDKALSYIICCPDSKNQRHDKFQVEPPAKIRYTERKSMVFTMGKEEIRMSEPFVSGILSNKYDTALDFHVTMYDNLPYQRDSDYCNIEKVTLVSGHVIKYYLCYNQPETFAIDNKDDIIEEILAEAQIAEQKYTASRRMQNPDASANTEISQEQIQTLLDDREASPEHFSDAGFEEEDELAAPENTVNAFADVEDW